MIDVIEKWSLRIVVAVALFKESARVLSDAISDRQSYLFGDYNQIFFWAAAISFLYIGVMVLIRGVK